MDPKFGHYSIDQEVDTIACRICGKRGKIFWDKISRVPGSMRDILGIDGPFFERLSKKPPYPIELVCRDCGGVALTAYPSTSLHDRQAYN